VVIFDIIVWILLIFVEPWRRLGRNFSHVLAIEAKTFLETCGAQPAGGGSSFPLGAVASAKAAEDDDK
jgi:hypothetical protein